MNKTIRGLKSNPLARSFGILSSDDQKKVVIVAIVQFLIGSLDLLGIAAIGLFGSLAITGLQSDTPGNQVNSMLKFLQISDFSLQSQTLILSLGALTFFIVRTVFSIVFTRKILFFFSRRGASISADLVSRLLAQPLLVIQSRTTQQTLFGITTGVNIITLQVLATTVVIISDLSMLIIVMLSLFLVEIKTALATLFTFLSVAMVLNRIMHSRAGRLGEENSQLNIKSSEKIVELMSSYRESVVRNRRYFYSREIRDLRYKLAKTSAEISFLPYISKYVLETTVIIAAIMFGLLQLFFNDAAQAFSTLTIFLAAGTRMAPAVLRVQQGTTAIRTGLGQATPTLELIESLREVSLIENSDLELSTHHFGFDPTIDIQNASFKYPGTAVRAISKISLTIPAGSSVAIVGPSGSGKTTLIDITFGILHMDEGQVSISGMSPSDAIKRWPGAISYVPQDVAIAAGSIRENVTLGYLPSSVDDESIYRALRLANLEDFVRSLPKKLENQVGESGARISGGQRQRLGIARAMITQPQILVLDEATSSLDGETESAISSAIQGLRGLTTVVMIAHRLSTVRNSDLVVYLDKGEILAQGTFEDVRRAVPNFNEQAKLMGL